MLGDGAELALLDAREEGAFAERHLFHAGCLPLSHLELRAARLLPRRGVRIVVCDDGEGVAEAAAERLDRFGYSDVSVLDGGIDGWETAGFPIYSGINVPCKAFGEYVEHAAATPHMSAAEVKALQDQGADLIILDSRPMPEFQRMSIPGGIDCPGAELVHRTFDLVASPETLVVVNCAGRTRSIIGAQSLIDAGLPNRVVALENGTAGWHLAGLDLERGQTRDAPVPSAAGLAQARAAAERVARRFGVRTIDPDGLAGLQGDPERTLYLLDVRGSDEFEAGHLPGSVSAPGGQLVQATDTYVGVRNARLVLVDDNGVRDRMTAAWLLRMGWTEVYVLEGGLAGATLETGPAEAEILGLGEAEADAYSVERLAAAIADGSVRVVDLDNSLAYRAGHVPGAWFAIRARLRQNLDRVPGDGRPLVFTCPDGILARLAAAEAASWCPRSVAYLDGGTAAWRDAGHPLGRGPENLADETDDLSYRPYDHTSGVEQRMRDYLEWEVELLERIRDDDDVNYPEFPPAGQP